MQSFAHAHGPGYSPNMRDVLNDKVNGVLGHDRHLFVKIFVLCSRLLTRIHAAQDLLTTLSDTLNHLGDRWESSTHPFCAFICVDEHIELSCSCSLVLKAATNISLNANAHIITHFSCDDLRVITAMFLASLSSVA